MTRAISVADLKTRIRQQTEQTSSKFISDDELLNYIDLAATELYDLLVTQFQDYFLHFAKFDTIKDVNVYALPANFYKMRDLDYTIGDKTDSMEKIPFSNRKLYMNQVFAGYRFERLKYCIAGNTLIVLPTPQQAIPVTMWFVPTMPRITSDSQMVAGFGGYEDLLIQDCCARIAIKAEEDPRPFERKKALLIERIEAAARQRDVGSPDSVIDSTGVTYSVLY